HRVRLRPPRDPLGHRSRGNGEGGRAGAAASADREAERGRRVRRGARGHGPSRAASGCDVNARLRPLRDDELPAYREHSERGYIEDISERGGVPRHLAEEKARRDFERLWPDGRPTEGQAIFAVEDMGTGEHVGYLWIAER